MVGRNNEKYVIGIDEAGRGPLAGPVVVAGVGMSPQLARSVLAGIRDSKKLGAKKREEWYRRLTEHPKIEWAAARVSHTVIDRINIRQAANLGARRVHRMLLSGRRPPLPSLYDRMKMVVPVFLDGGLILPRGARYQTIIKGDEKIPVIAAASIIAKVTRDRIMCRLHKRYSQYRFDLHKGYGTLLHREMIQKYGRCEIHRKSFRCVEKFPHT